MNKYASASRRAQLEAYRRRSCDGKRRYASRETAVHPNTTVYHCRFCGGWHRSSAAWTTASVLTRYRRLAAMP